MYDALAKYLWERKNLSLPMIGSFKWEMQSAETDHAAESIASPKWNLTFVEDNNSSAVSATDHLTQWLAADQNITEQDSANRVNLFSTELKAKLKNGETITWPGVGNLVIENDQIIFNSEEEDFLPFKDIKANKIKRGDASYNYLVGDKETTTAKMRDDLIAESTTRRSGKGIWILLLVAVTLIAIYFFRNGCNMASTGNNAKAPIEKTPETYKLR